MRVRPNNSIDVAAPPDGQRLELGTVAAALKVSVTDLASATGLPRTSAFRLLNNVWPARLTDAAKGAIKADIEALLRAQGATDHQIATLWFGRTGRNSSRRPGHDYYDRDLARPRGGAQPNVEDHDMLLAKQTLSPQARRHFKLFVNPFDGEVTTDAQFFNGADMGYVREAAWQCCQNSGFVALVGESGAGKTTMLADLEARIQAEGRGVIMIKPSVLGMEENNARGQMLKSTDILHALISTLQPDATMPQTLQARTVRAHKMLTASTETGAVHLLVIEEAHGLPDATLKHLKRLHELRNGRRSLLGILLIAQTELKLRLAKGLQTGTLREVAQRCEIVELLPLDGDLRAYLDCRAAAANRKLDELIEPAAVDQMRTRLTRKTSTGTVSMCYPLAANNMATKALNLAAELGVPTVTADVVKDC